ncbi:MAG: tetratricopeptide repeat protein [Bacteroidales bacterium]|nr:tetratricopeptide repeat protein [Bacteroidales bacterium]
MKLKRIIASLLIAASAMAAVPGIAQDKKAGKTEENRVIDAVAAIDAQQFKEAEALLGSITATDPSNDAAWYYLGLCHLYKNNVKDAQTALKKASELDPSNYWYKDRLAIAYSMTGEDDLTIATYEDLLKEFPKKNEIYFSLVNLYLKQNQFDKALAAMDQIETVFGKNENVTTTRYDILLRQNKPEEALKTLEDYNKEFSSPFVLTKLGDHTMAEYKDSVALAYYQEALDIQSDYMPALLGEAEVYRVRRNYDEFFSAISRFVDNEETIPQAKAQYLSMLLQRSEPRFIRNFQPRIDSLYEGFVLRHPSDSSALKATGMYYYATERVDKAKSYLKRNMDTHPGSLDATATYVQFLGYLSDWDTLGPAADSAMVRFPKETAFLELKNVACYNKQDWQGIIDNSKRMISIAPGDTAVTVPALANIGDMYHEMGNEVEAFRYYKQVLKISPNYAPTLNNYAYYLALKGKSLKKACAMSKKTIEKEPDNATYLDTYGWILHLLGKDHDAKAVFKHALIYGAKDSATSLEHYAEVLESLGETDLAKVYRTQAANKKAEGKE